MKRVLMVLLVAMAGCASVGDTSPAEVAGRVCPPVEAAISVLAVPGAVAEDVAPDVVLASQAVAAACSAGDAVQIGGLRDVLPVLRRVIELAPIDVAEKQAAVLGLAVAQAAIGAMR